MPKTKWLMLFVAAGLILGGGLFAWQQESFEPVITAAEGDELSSVFFVQEETLPARIPEAQSEDTQPSESETVPWIRASEPLLVNINTADAAELTKLPGIGPAKAEAILRFRAEHGGFSSIEELMLVPGIKGATFAKLRDYVTV